MDSMIIEILAFAGATLTSLLIWNLKRTIDKRDKDMENMGNEIHLIKESLPRDYVSKIDFKADIKDLKDGIDKIMSYLIGGK